VRNRSSSDYDVVVVGASLAGCTTAILLARGGARVALVERRPDPNAFKRVCGHFIQSSAVPALDRAGLLEPIERAGGVRSRARLWTRWGWIEPPGDPIVPACVNLRRERLDPLVRRIAAETPGVELILGATVDRVLFDHGRACGVETRDPSGRRAALGGRLIVGADGRDSKIAELAGLEPRVKPHGRFSYAAYFEGPALANAPNGSIWFLDPQWAAAFPTDSGLTLYGCMLTYDRLPEFRRDPERALRSFIADLPEAPPISASSIVGSVFGKLQMPNVRRGPVRPGLALVGDAALSADPLYGVGCGWAFQSAEWLAGATAPAVRGEEKLEIGLRRYRKQFRRELLAHNWMIDDYATGRRMNLPERLLFSAAAYDHRLAARFEAFGTRNVDPRRFLPAIFPHAIAVHARRRLGIGGVPAPERQSSLHPAA
jgi:flavin-dependent dehydrogenase